MDPSTYLLQLFLILLFARLLGELAAKKNIPAVLGELTAGILIGPSILGWVQPDFVIKLLADIGIILLLFEVGLETNLYRLFQTGSKPLLVAIGGVVLPFAFGFALSHFVFQMTMVVSLLIGSTLTATSIGITMRILADLKRQSGSESQIILGAAVIDDIIGIILLSVVYEFSKGSGINIGDIGKVSLLIILFLLLAPLAAKIISSAIKRYEKISAVPGLVPTSIVSLILLFSWLAHALDAPELIGGFAAGLALSPHFHSLDHVLNLTKRFSHTVETQMKSIIHLFTPIFFVTVGLSLNLREIDWSSLSLWLLFLSLLVAAILGKLASGFLLFKDKNWVKWSVGLAMIPRGEMGLIFAEVGKNHNIIDSDTYAALILVITATTLLAPFAMRFFYISKKLS